MDSGKTRKKIRGVLGVFHPSFIRSCLRGDSREVRRWYRKGCPAPAPPSIKFKVLTAYANSYKPPVFIETGTYHGDTPYVLRNCFETLYTIELSPELFAVAKTKLQPFSNIKQLLGDSSTILGELLPTIKTPCMLWLDGHYSGGVTAKGNKECPLLEELAHVWRHPIKQHVILLDDVRHFGIKPDYPQVSEVVSLAKSAGYEAEVHYDMLCLTPRGSPQIGAQLRESLK